MAFVNFIFASVVYVKNDGLVPKWAASALESMPVSATFQACRSGMHFKELNYQMDSCVIACAKSCG